MHTKIEYMRRLLEKHKKIGILGGVGPESAITYYEHIVRTYRERFGDHSYPEILIYSVSFQTLMDWQREKMLDKIEGLLNCRQLFSGTSSYWMLEIFAISEGD